MVRELLMLSLGTALIHNFILTQFLGVEPLVNSANNIKQAAKLGLAVIVLMVLVSGITWVVNSVFLVYLELEYLKTFVFIVVIIALVQLTEMILKKFKFSLGVRLPELIANSAILGLALINISEFAERGGNFVSVMVNALAAGIGFLIVVVLFAGIKERLDLKNIPLNFRGAPIALISIALIAIAFLGFTM